MIEKSFSPNFVTYVLEREPRTFKEAVNSTAGIPYYIIILGN